MKSKEVTIELASGLEARPVAMLVQVASQYESRIYMEYANKKVNAKSIMGTISLAIKEDDTISIVATGEDEDKAVEEICKILC